MKNLLIRTITGTVYVLATIGALLLGRVTFGIYFALAMGINLFEFYRLAKVGGYRPLVVPGIVVGIYLFFTLFLHLFYQGPANLFLGLVPLILLIPLIELFRKNNAPTINIAFTVMGVVYIAIPFSMLSLIASPLNSEGGEFIPNLLIALFVILWANDSGAYLVGSAFGKHKLLERISPKKTWEGFIGGAFLAAITAVVVFHFIGYLNPWQAVLASVITVIAGTTGDLTESMIKRHFNVKDSGNILPGHGGLLDRFDSLLFSAPIYFAFISIILNHRL